MTTEEAQEIIQLIKDGKRYENVGHRSYTGDYTMTIVLYKNDGFHIETYDCHNDAGDRLIRSSEKTEEETIQYLKIGDYQKTFNSLRD